MAKLTINEALQKAAAAHKAGKKQEAGRLLRSVLNADPAHPDANHNMGVFWSSQGRLEKALPFYKMALEGNFSVSQFWYSYIDTLVKLGRIHEGQALLEDAESKGAKGTEFESLKQNIKSIEKIYNLQLNKAK